MPSVHNISHIPGFTANQTHIPIYTQKILIMVKVMIIASIIKHEKETGDHILVMKLDELQTMLEVFTVFCDNNKRKKKAKNMLKQFEDNLQVY